MTMKTKVVRDFCILILIFTCNFSVFSQVEEITPLYINHSLSSIKNISFPNAKLKAVSSNDTLSLPFKDDFSKWGPYPDAEKWIRSTSVFVNNTFPLNPKTLGVATFDGLDKNGYPYKIANQVGSFPSDTLTSKPIKMGSNLSPADSVYLSFYFQTKGLGGDAPEVNDVLTLDFYDPKLDTFLVKKTFFRPNNSTIYDNNFTCVMVPVTEARWFANGFKFRFRNKSTACGSVDLWHIDNVYLGKNRNMYDTVLNDVAFAYPPKSLLKNYSAMPHEQYIASLDMGTTTHLYIRDNDTAIGGINITGYMDVLSNLGTSMNNQMNGSGDIFPYFPNGYCKVSSIADPIYAPFAYPGGNALKDTVSYIVKHYIKTSAFDVNKSNDTVTFRQKFYNYFAYDDGTAEAGYQLSNAYGAEVAVRYDVNVKDTIQAVDICFNPVILGSQITQLTFGIYIWNDAGGIPGSVVYYDTLLYPAYSAIINYPFVRYKLNKALILTPGTYYVGMKQDDQQPLNVGFDFNTDSQLRNFYNTNGSWANSSYQGSLMIRPIFGDYLSSIDNITQNLAEEKTEVIIYPNPAKDYFLIHLKNSDQSSNPNLEIECYDVLGNKIFSQLTNVNKEINTNYLSDGIYFIHIKQNNYLIASKKLLIAH